VEGRPDRATTSRSPIIASQASADYVEAGRLLIEDAAYAGLVYSMRGMLVKPYAQGVGFNAL
jgi:hypothetical protein